MDILDEEALRRLFPDAFWQPFLEQGTRPDGRPSSEARPASIGLGAVSNAASSALVKLGNTAVLAAIQLEVMKPQEATPDHGCCEISFGMPPVCSPSAQPGRTPEDVHLISHQLKSLLSGPPCMDLKELCIVPKVSAWVVYLDLVCIDADGSLLDAALLAALAAFDSLELPALVRRKGGMLLADAGDEGSALGSAGEGDTGDVDMDSNADGGEGEEEEGQEEEGVVVRSQVVTGRTVRHKGRAFRVSGRKPRLLRFRPVGQTLSVGGDKQVLLDPTAEEERLWGGNNTVSLVFDALTLDSATPKLLALFKAGGPSPAPTLASLKDHLAAAQSSALEKHRVLLEALQQLDE